MELLHERKLLYGISSCYTSANYESITSEEYYDQLIRMGRLLHLVLPLHARGQRRGAWSCCPRRSSGETVYRRIRQLPRREAASSPWTSRTTPSLWAAASPAGARYLHINANGDVDPCVFIHYSDSNIREMSLLEALQIPDLYGVP